MKQGQLSWFCPELVHVWQVLLVCVTGHTEVAMMLLHKSHPYLAIYLCSETVNTELLKKTWPWISLYDPVVLAHIILNLHTTCADNWESPEMYYSCACFLPGFSAIFIDYDSFLRSVFFSRTLWSKSSSSTMVASIVVNPNTLLRMLVQTLFLRKALSMFTSNICAAEAELLSKSLTCICLSQKIPGKEQSLAWKGTVTPKKLQEQSSSGFSSAIESLD